MKRAIIVSVWLLMASRVMAQPTRELDRTMPIGPAGSVTLTTRGGSISVRTWDRQETQIHARIQAASTEREDVSRFDDTTIEVQTTGDGISIRSRYPTFTFGGWWFGINPKIDYTITAPAGVRWIISTHNAATEIRGVHSAITIETHDGPVHLSDVDGPIQVTAHNANVRAELVTFRGADFSLHQGSVTIALPATAGFHVHADTRSGGVESDFPLAQRSGGRRQTTVDAIVGSGGPTLMFMSRGGVLRLKTK